MDKQTIGQIIEIRFKGLIKKMISLSFVTWCIIFVAYIVNKQPIDFNFCVLTAAIIGIKQFTDKGIDNTKKTV